ncbi:MAG TPA: HAMP domain-containing sensor histidine kinase [Novosphingobium sp.]
MISPLPRNLAGNLGGRVTLACACFALVTCLLGLLTYRIVHEEIEKHLDQRINAEAEALLAAAVPRGLPGVIEAIRAREATHLPGDLGYIVLARNGRRVAGTLAATPPPKGYTEFVHYRHSDGTRGIAQALNVAIPGGGSLIVAADRSDVNDMDRTILTIFGVTTGLIAAIGIGATVMLRRMVARRLAAMSATAEAIMAGDLSRRMPILRDAEFDQVAQVINRMLDRIEALLENLRQLSTDLAHDIRSPLNRVRGSLEAFERKSGAEGIAADAIADIDDLLDLLGGLLGISEIEGFAVRERFVPLDIAQLAADVVDAYRPDVEEAGMRIAFAGNPVEVMGDPALLRRCLANLIDNALLHAIGATLIDVRVSSTGLACEICVSDDGQGIPPGARAAIFRRFVRLDPSRTTPGHGLGLNMVLAIMRAHYGSAEIIPSERGLMLQLSLPVLASEGYG